MVGRGGVGSTSKSVSMSQLKKEQDLMSITAEAAERVKEKERRKEESAATFGWQAFTADAEYRAYKKQLGKLGGNSGGGGERGRETDAASIKMFNQDNEVDLLNYGQVTSTTNNNNNNSSISNNVGGSGVSSAGLTKLVSVMEEREAQREKHSRRRMDIDSASVDAINEKNAFFNKKIKRSFDKYTVEIRQSLERGTAV